MPLRRSAFCRRARTSFTSTDNYYTSATGKVVTQWPDCETLYAVLTRVLRRVSTLGRRTRRPRTTQQEPVPARV